MNRDRWCMNQPMTKALQRDVDASAIRIPDDIESLLSSGVVESDDTLHFRDGQRLNRSDFLDLTGLEAAESHLHLDAKDDSIVDLFVAFEIADRIHALAADASKAHGVRVIVSRDIGEHVNSTVRFHMLRPNETWLAPDIETYSEPVAYRDTLPICYPQMRLEVESHLEPLADADWARRKAADPDLPLPGPNYALGDALDWVEDMAGFEGAVGVTLVDEREERLVRELLVAWDVVHAQFGGPKSQWKGEAIYFSSNHWPKVANVAAELLALMKENDAKPM